MAELSDDDKMTIVQQIACFRGYAEVVAFMRAEHSVETDVQQVRTYDPTNPRFEAGEKWRPIFEATRKAYIEDVSAVPIANQGFRLNELHRLYVEALKAKNRKLAADLMRQAAEEVGGALTNQRRVDMHRVGPSELAPDERRNALVDLLSRALAKDGKSVVEGTATAQ
jgi:hypothetical protein